jgi:elongation factor Ts
MSDCKSALVESAGDMEKAVEIILKKGLARARSARARSPPRARSRAASRQTP